MSTVSYLARRQFRHAWRSLVGIALLIAVAGGLSLGAVAAGNRNASVVERFDQANAPWDVLLNPVTPDFGPSTLRVQDVRALPQVAQVSSAIPVFLAPAAGLRSAEEVYSAPILLAVDGGALHDYTRPVLSEGRVPAADSPDEVFVQQYYADAHDLHAGDPFDVRTYSEAEMGQVWGSPSPAAQRAILARPGFGTLHRLTIAGVGATQDSMLFDESFEPQPFLAGPAVGEALAGASPGWAGIIARLKDPADLPSFQRSVEALVPRERMVYMTWEATRVQARRAVQPAAVALWIFAGVTALLGLLLVGQAMSRRLQWDAGRRPLATLGVTHGQRALTALAVLLPVVLVGAALAVALAYATSWFTPVGFARAAEVSPGPMFDARVLLPGAVVLVLAVLAVAAFPAWRASRVEPVGSAGQARASPPGWRHGAPRSRPLSASGSRWSRGGVAARYPRGPLSLARSQASPSRSPRSPSQHR